MTDKINFPKITIEKEIPNETLEQIRQIAPNVLEDGKVNCKKLNEAIGEMLVDPDEPEHFGLNWPGKRQSIKLARTPSKQTLIPVPGDGVDEDKTQNLFIEGENMEVLKLLQKSYSGRIKMIYIDPPYNTGSDLIYKDKFTETEKNFLESTGQIDEEGNDMVANKKSSGRFHTNWLNMIYPRLKLAKELLTDDGVIFVSIDDNEVHNLRAVTNEVFGEENFIAQIVWRKKYGGGKGSTYFVDLHEYILCYVKDINNVKGFSLERNDEQKQAFILEDEYVKDRGKYYIRPLKSGLGERKTLIYPIELPDGTNITTQWICAEETFKELKDEGRIIFKKLKNNTYNVYKKFYEKDKGGVVMPESIFYDIAFNQNGKEDIKTLFEIKEGREIPFDNPKPVKLIKYLLLFASGKNSIICDFFSGSGTTGQAVMELNAKDNEKRKYICVQISEPLNIDIKSQKYGAEFCTSIGKKQDVVEISKERIRRAGKKIKEETKAEIDYGFKVFKLQKESNLKDESEMFGMTDQLTLESAEENLSSLRKDWTKEKLLTEILLIEGFPLTSKIEKSSITTNEILIVTSSFEDRPDKLVVCLDPEINRSTIDNLPVGELDNFIFLESSLPKVGGDEIKQILHERFKSRIKVI